MDYRRANNILVILILAINLYVLAAPFSNLALNWWRLNHTDLKQQLTTKIVQQSQSTSPSMPASNHVIIPDAGIDTDVYDGSYRTRYDTLKKGVWRYNQGSTPPQGGNTVLIGHRFTYTNPRGVFYSLDKVHLGSAIAVRWDSQQHIYTVSSIKVVAATDTAIQAPTENSQLTLFTCTPLLHPTQRLVVTATLKESHE